MSDPHVPFHLHMWPLLQANGRRGIMAQAMRRTREKVLRSFVPCQFQTGSGAPFWGRRTIAHSLIALIMSALLDSLKYDPNFGNAAASGEDLNSESKFGIPRFGGEAAGLAEYAFRVRARVQRESLMDKDETRKYGPLGLRLMEGLRGPALVH